MASTWLDVEHARVWITTQDGGLGTLDLKTLIPSRILLDADARQVVSLGDELAVIHPSQSGFVTLFDADKPSLGSARALLGFFWDGVLE